MFSRKNKSDKIQLLENEIDNYKSQMTALGQEIQYLKQKLQKQENDFLVTLHNRDIAYYQVLEENKRLKEVKIDMIPEEYICKICMDNPINCVLEPCMHFCICQNCIEILTERKCPICRQDTPFYTKLFIS